MIFPSSLRRGCAPVSKRQTRQSRERLGRCKLTNANDCKTLMDEHGPPTNVTPGPVGAAMALSLGESNKSRPVSSGVREVMDGEYATHFFACERRWLRGEQFVLHHQSPQNFHGVTNCDKIRFVALLKWQVRRDRSLKCLFVNLALGWWSDFSRSPPWFPFRQLLVRSHASFIPSLPRREVNVFFFISCFVSCTLTVKAMARDRLAAMRVRLFDL